VQPKQKTKTGFAIWFTLVIIGVLLATFIPYGILGSLAPSLAIFGFWSAFGLAIIGFIVWGVKDWRNEQ
jgi:hypothetical protein